MLRAILVAAVALALPTTASGYGPEVERKQASAKVAICKTFGPYCAQALRVSWCESRWYVYASNGQYQGLFQMGSSERAIYGHGRGAWAQARAAHRYFVASGRDWSPWSCKP